MPEPPNRELPPIRAIGGVAACLARQARRDKWGRGDHALMRYRISEHRRKTRKYDMPDFL